MSIHLEVFHKRRSDSIDGNTVDQRIDELCDSVAWFRGEPAVEEKEKESIASRYREIERAFPSAGQHKSILLPLRYFVSVLTPPEPQRVGLEAEYVRSVFTRNVEETLKYDQLIGTVLSAGKLLARLKLDGISANTKSAILELELRPYPLGSEEYLLQLQVIEKLRVDILGARKDSDVRDLLEPSNRSSRGYRIVPERKDPLFFGSLEGELGPFCQATIELSLGKLGDPADAAILDLVEGLQEKALLVCARKGADALVGIMRPIAAKLHGDVFEEQSIKLAKLRGYWTQCIVQACQVICYEKKKERVGFHIRAAGPFHLGAREKKLLKMFFDAEKFPELEWARSSFQATLRNALDAGIDHLAGGSPCANKESSIDLLLTMLMKFEDFSPSFLQFKSGSVFHPIDTLEFRYGMTLVELRCVRSPLNRGIMRNDSDAVARIKRAQDPLAPRPKKKIVKIPKNPFDERGL